MGSVIKIGISKKKGGEIIDLSYANVFAGKGIENDRFYNINNNKSNHISIIESEQIDSFNSAKNLSIPYINFRRNIVTKNIKLNNLVGKIFLIGKIKIKAIQLCEPCVYLSSLLKEKEIVKFFVHKAGIRCEILNNGTISIEDEIKN